jgi:hypothetical protein
MNFNGLAVRTRWFWISVLVVFFAVSNTFAYAENLSQLSKKPLEAWEQAQDYSLAHPVVAFAIYGRTQDATTRENAEKIKKFLQNKNITSMYFLGKENTMGSSVAFFIQGVAYGPKGLSKALPVIKQVITHYKEEYSSSR